MFILSKVSRRRLKGVHLDLIFVVTRAIHITKVDFVVLEGLRTIERQRELVAAGASWTLNSRHLTGHAVDLGAYLDGSVRWDWPLYYEIADAMKVAARELGIPITWGGDWETKRDGPHWELPLTHYPRDLS